MSWNDPYVDIDDLKARLGIDDADATQDAKLAAALIAASRQIDGSTLGAGRQFNQTTEARVFDGWSWYGSAPCFEIGDIVSVSEIASDDGTLTYPTVWAATSYRLMPLNASNRGRPYREVAPPAGLWWTGWPTPLYGVRVTGVWGWPAVPDAVVEACLILAQKLYGRPNAPFGIVQAIPDAPGTPVRGGDPDAALLLAPFRSLAV